MGWRVGWGAEWDEVEAMMCEAFTLGATVVEIAVDRAVGSPGVAGGVRGWVGPVEVGDLGRLVRALSRSYFLNTCQESLKSV